MTDAPAPSVYALLDDLFFRVKIEATASAAGVEVAFAKTLEDLVDRLDARPGVTTVLVDLEGAGSNAEVVVGTLVERTDPPRVVAFGSHRNREGLAAASDAGAETVLPRSDFVRALADILRDARAREP